jgi:hypothetical protein
VRLSREEAIDAEGDPMASMEVGRFPKGQGCLSVTRPTPASVQASEIVRA